MSLMSPILLPNPVTILMTVALKLPSGMLLIFVSLKSLAVTLSYLIIWNKSLHLGIVSAIFSVLQKPVMSPAPESNGLMKKKRSWHFRECFRCVLHVLCCCVVAALPFRLVICRGSACLLCAVWCLTWMWIILTRCALICLLNETRPQLH